MLKPLPEIERTPYREAIKASGLKIAQVAKYMNLSYAYTSAILCGTVNMTPDNKAKLETLFDSLVWGTDD